MNNIYINIYFIYLSFDECLGRFHSLIIVNNAARAMSVQISLCDTDFNSSGYTYPGVELLDNMGVQFLIFIGIKTCLLFYVLSTEVSVL